MKALQYDGHGLDLVELASPRPSTGGVVVDVRAAGLCHSDLTVMARPLVDHPFGLPLVLGHEIAGVVSAIGPDVTDVSEGDSVVVYGPWGCGSCRVCRTGAENLCPHARAEGIFPPGLGAPGGLAQQVHVPNSRHVVPIGELDPVQAAPLTDAGLTTYNAIRRASPALPVGGTAVVIGVGGLGHLALQLLRVMTTCTIIAVDTSPAARALAERLGADVILDPTTAPVDEQIRSSTSNRADVVLDFVASDRTLNASAAMLRPGGHLAIVGVGSGALPVAVGRIPLDATVHTPFWGTLGDLRTVIRMAREGRVTSAVETFTLDDAAQAYERLRRGQVMGRAVITPDPLEMRRS